MARPVRSPASRLRRSLGWRRRTSNRATLSLGSRPRGGCVPQSTTSKAYRLVRSIFATAVDDEVIVRNPCRIKGASVDRTPERPVLALDEVFRLAGVIEHRYRAMVLLAVFGSLRYGELLGLTRADLDLSGARLHVRRAVAEVNGSLVVKAPKTAAGTRTVALPRWVADELVDHLQRYAEPGDDGRLFVGPKGSSPRRSHFSQVWKRARVEADISEAVISMTSATPGTTWLRPRVPRHVSSWVGWGTRACGPP